MLAIGFVCCLGDLCLALHLYVIFGNYVLHWVCLFVGWVNDVLHWVCLFVGWVNYVWNWPCLFVGWVTYVLVIWNKHS